MANMKNIKWYLLVFIALIFVLLIQKAIPFFTLPTVSQVATKISYSLSFANGSFFDLYSHDFGIPKPAAISFGLAGVWPASLFIRLGVAPLDAYTLTTALFLSIAMLYAFKLVRLMGASKELALIASVAWMTMPTIWAHSEFSMLSWGIALFSFYFFAAYQLFLVETKTKNIALSSIILYFFACFIAVFMDGYTFMMFALGSSLLCLFSFLYQKEVRKQLLKIAVPVHILSFLVAYLLYSLYIGKSGFSGSDLTFFRAWGLDLTYLIIPTKNIFWLWDLLNITQFRNSTSHFGDWSVWTTTFALPIIILGLFAWWYLKSNQIKIAHAFLLIAIISFYLALGPSLKINSIKPINFANSNNNTSLMAAEYAVMATGNAWVFEYLPGFKSMRATYRWTALGIFAFWILLVLALSKAKLNNKNTPILILGIFILFNLPNLYTTWQEGNINRILFQRIDSELVVDLKKYIKRNEKVAFLPWGNDFSVNYLAPSAGFRTLNIGGDKNLFAALPYWPYEMSFLDREYFNNNFDYAVKMLVDSDVDVLVIPYINMLRIPLREKCNNNLTQQTILLEPYIQEYILNIPCPHYEKEKLKSIIYELQQYNYLEVTDTDNFAVITLKEKYKGLSQQAELIQKITTNVTYPINLRDEYKEKKYLLPQGWYPFENNYSWSNSVAQLNLPTPDNCGNNNCYAIIQFKILFGVDANNKREVFFESNQANWKWKQKVVVENNNIVKVEIPLSDTKQVRQISIHIPSAKSPQELGISSDYRKLGIALEKIDFIKK